MTKDKVLALDIGGTNTRLGLVGRGGAIEGFRRLRSSEWNQDRPLERLGDLMEDYLKQEAPGGVLAISMGFPGAVDKACRTLVNVPTIPELDGAPVADVLEERFKTPVFIDNDVVMLYFQAAQELNMPKSEVTLCFFIGTGLGNLIVLDGKVHVGAQGIAAELGHIPVYGKDGLCGCGNRGCAELYCAGHGMVSLRNRHYPGEDPDLLFTLHVNEAPVQEYLDLLAQVMATEMIILDPDTVLMGGGIVAMPDFPFEMLRAKVSGRLRGRDTGEKIRWFRATDAQRAGVAGAGLYAFNRLGGAK